MGTILHCYSVAVRSYSLFLPIWVENDLPEATIVPEPSLPDFFCGSRCTGFIAINTGHRSRSSIGFSRRFPNTRLLDWVLVHRCSSLLQATFNADSIYRRERKRNNENGLALKVATSTKRDKNWERTNGRLIETYADVAAHVGRPLVLIATGAVGAGRRGLTRAFFDTTA
jgi:hypothetical protein